MLKIATVISSFNRGEPIRSTINSLLNQTLEIGKIIVVDNGSSEEKKVPKFENKKVEVKHIKENFGPVWGRNYGLSLVGSYDYVLILDDDIELEKEALKLLYKTFKDKGNCMASMPVLYFKGNKKRVWSSGSGVNLLTGQTMFFTDIPKYKYRKIPAATSVFLVDMKKLKKSGWYDPIYYFNYEDADFYYRLAKVNRGSLYCVRDADAYHDICENLSLERVAARSYLIARGRIIFLSRHSKYFPLNLPLVSAYALYYFYLGLKYSHYMAGIRFIQGMIDGLKVSLTKKTNDFGSVEFTNRLNLKKIGQPIYMRSVKVKR
jgi:GT2 family glycosyltransferase